MYLLLSFLCGLIVSPMNIFNGQLSAHCGVYLATVIIHLIGLITFTLIMFLKKQEISFKHHLPFILYTGGVIGVFNVLILNIVVSKVTPIKLTLITFISQLLSGMILDYYIYHVFTLNKLIGCIIVIIGLIIYQSADIKVISNEEINSI